MNLRKLEELIGKEIARLKATGLDEDAPVEVAVEMGGTTRVAPLRSLDRVGDKLRLVGRP